MRWIHGAAAVAFGLALALFAGRADAQAKGKGGAKAAKAAAPKPPAVDVKAIVEKVKSGDPSRVVDGLAAAQAGGASAKDAAPAIEDLLRRGASEPVMKEGIEALGAIAQPSSSATLRTFLGHRVPELRRAAAKALVATKGPEAVAAFKQGLRSPDGSVRGYSATGLGALGATDALPELFLALDRNITEAAAAIGQLCAPNDCEKFAGRLGKVPFDVMTFGFDAILLRPKPLPEPLLLGLVGRLRELGTPEAGKYLANVESQFPKDGSARVKAAIDNAVSSIPGAKQ